MLKILAIILIIVSVLEILWGLVGIVVENRSEDTKCDSATITLVSIITIIIPFLVILVCSCVLSGVHI